MMDRVSDERAGHGVGVIWPQACVNIRSFKVSPEAKALRRYDLIKPCACHHTHKAVLVLARALSHKQCMLSGVLSAERAARFAALSRLWHCPLPTATATATAHCPRPTDGRGSGSGSGEWEWEGMGRRDSQGPNLRGC